MVKRLIACSLMLTFFALVATAQTPRGSITIEHISEIKYPSNQAWSPDGKMVAFLWDSWGKQDLFVVTPGQKPVALTDFPLDPDLLVSDINSLAWVSPTEILFSKDGQLWTVSPSSAEPMRYPGLADAGNFTLSRDRTQIAFVQGGDIWFASLEAETRRQVTVLPDGMRGGNPMFSPDGRWIAFTTTRRTSLPESFPLPFNGNLIRSFRTSNPSGERRLGVVSVFGGDVRWIPTIGRISAVQFTSDGSVLYQERSSDGKTREIKVAPMDGAPHTLWKDYDDRWWSPTHRVDRTVVSPDGRSVAFVSDRSGWTHVYMMPVDAESETEARQLTSGNYGAGLPNWSPDSKRIAYQHSVDGNQMVRFIDIFDVGTGGSETIVTEIGVNLNPAFSPDGANILYQRTDPQNSLDLYTAPAHARASSVRLSDSMPAGLDKADLTTPVPVYFPSRHDGAQVPATLMVPENLDRTRRHPAIVWIHGSGSDQNYIGWHPGAYRMYYSVHQYLVQQGYIILTPDYRGSSGYSREWTTGVHMGVGVSDTADVASGADYLKTLDYVDPDRIGVWGLSYGGFMTLQALNTDPRLWRCGINVAGVVDWATYGAGYTTPRLGTPVENPEIYDISAPVKHMDRLERPLMVMHGTNDTNVAFHDSLRLIDVLVKLGKDFETVIYPGEIHFFRRAFVLRDAWTRAERFFDEHLRKGPLMTSQ